MSITIDKKCLIEEEERKIEIVIIIIKIALLRNLLFLTHLANLF